MVVCYQDMVSWTSWTLKMGLLGYPRCQNGITTLCRVKSNKRAGPKTCSISVCPSIRRMPNVQMYMCCLSLLQKISSRVKLHELPGQGIGPALPTQHLCSRFKISFIPKNHHTWEFQLLIAHKPNPHTKNNQLALTAKILSEPGIQLCVCNLQMFNQAKQTFVAAWTSSLACSTFRSHLNTNHTCDSPEIKKIFQLQYGMVKQWPSQQMCLATGSIVLCLHVVQQCGCKITHREWKWCIWWHCYTVW